MPVPDAPILTLTQFASDVPGDRASSVLENYQMALVKNGNICSLVVRVNDEIFEFPGVRATVAVTPKGALRLDTTYTQTYSTANATHANRTAAALTDNSGGEAADGTIAEIADIALSTSDTYTDSAVNTAVNAAVDDASNAVKELSDQINKVIADQVDTAQLLNSLIDDLQAD